MDNSEFERKGQIEEYLSKPNQFKDEFKNKPVFSGLSFSEHDFKLLSEVLHDIYLRFVEDGSDVYSHLNQERIGDIMDKCDKIVSRSSFVKETLKRLRLRKELRSINESMGT